MDALLQSVLRDPVSTNIYTGVCFCKMGAFFYFSVNITSIVLEVMALQVAY